jgi:hypothetical protein
VASTGFAGLGKNRLWAVKLLALPKELRRELNAMEHGLEVCLLKAGMVGCRAIIQA